MPWNAPTNQLANLSTLERLKEWLMKWLGELFGTAEHHEMEVDIAYGTTVRPNGNRSGSQRIIVTDSDAFTVANPANPREGQQITLAFINEAQANIGAVTFGSEYVLDGAFVGPELGGQVLYRFGRGRDGKWREFWRSKPLPESGTGTPTAFFTVSISGRTVTVTNSSTPATGTTLTAYAWDWGDGATSTLQNPPAHLYAADGTYTISLTVTASNALQHTFSRPVTVAGGAVTLGKSFGPFSLFATTTTLKPNAEPFNFGLENFNASTAVARIDAMKNLGMGAIMAMTGGGRFNYLTDGIFDRMKWSTKQQSFNTVAIINKVRAEMNNLPLVASVMDEPANAGGPGNEANSWGPKGTMSKAGVGINPRWALTVSSARSPGTVSVPITGTIRGPLPTGTKITFLPGQNKTLTLTIPADAGDGSVTGVLSAAVSAGDHARSNSVDNMVAEVKNIFGWDFPVGVFIDWSVFPTESFAVADFIISQYRYAKTSGNIAEYVAGAQALATRDGHGFGFSLNILDGGIPSTPSSGCPDVWNCGSNTGGRGTYCPNCRVTPVQLVSFAKGLLDAGLFLTMWRYDDAFMANADNKAGFQEIAAHAATLTRPTDYLR